MCEPSTVPGDTNKYCISPAVFVKQVQADSTVNSQSVCGLHPNQTACPANPCPAALPTCLPSGFCGVSDTGPDTITPSPSYFIPADPPQDNDGMFNFCSPGSQVNFTVTFQMPFQRGASVQEYQFDLGIYAGAGIIGRTRVIITNPALTVADYYRYYDGKQACAGTPGTHVVWGNLSYAAICPTDGAMPTPDYSQIRFCALAAATPGGAFVHEPPPIVDTPPTSGCAADEVVLGIASDAPAYNSCPGAAPAGMGSITGFNITSQLPISEKEDAFLRIRMEFDPSTPGDAVAPFLDSWTLDIDCVPSE
jgi:hypothetical protein